MSLIPNLYTLDHNFPQTYGITSCGLQKCYNSFLRLKRSMLELVRLICAPFFICACECCFYEEQFLPIFPVGKIRLSRRKNFLKITFPYFSSLPTVEKKPFVNVNKKDTNSIFCPLTRIFSKETQNSQDNRG